MNGLTEQQVRAIAQELCKHAEGGRPDHPRLLADIDRAVFVAQHSPMFRLFVETLAAQRARDVSFESKTAERRTT